MIERERSLQSPIPPGFDYSQWPPLKAPQENSPRPTQTKEMESFLQHEHPDLDMAAGSSFSGDSMTDDMSGEGARSVISPMVEDAPIPPLPLYKAKLLNSGSGRMEIEDKTEWELEKDDVMIDKSGLIPKILFSTRAKRLLVENMKSTVIIRLMEKTIGYRSLQLQINRIWKMQGTFHLIDLGNHFFMVRFLVEEDYINALTNGPWMVFGAYLTVQPWFPSFSPECGMVESIVAWIRLPNLPIHLYHQEVLKSIVGAVGKVFKVDKNTASFERGKYARFAVKIDLNKPLLPYIEIEGHKQRIEYEGLPSICFKCGCYGHLQSICPTIGKNNIQGEKSSHNAQAPIQSHVQASSAVIIHPGQTNEKNSSSPKSIEKSIYGPEMFVSQRSRKPPATNPSRTPQYDKGKGVANGSRFEILADVSVEGNQIDVTNNGGTCHENIETNNTVGMGKVCDKRKNIAQLSTTKIQQVETSSHNAKDLRLKKACRDPLIQIPQNARSLDPSKHSVSIITDDQIHYGPPSPIFSFPNEALVSNKENVFRQRNGLNRGRAKGIYLTQNIQKTLKFKKAKPTNEVKTAILKSMEDATNVPIS